MLVLPPPHHPWLLRAGTAPSTRPTSLRRYFLTKTYHLRLDPSADSAEAAAALAHNPPQASTSLSLPLLSLRSLLQFLLFFAALSHQVFQMLPSSHISVRFFKIVFIFFMLPVCQRVINNCKSIRLIIFTKQIHFDGQKKEHENL